MAAGSESISTRWVEGAVRECRQCGVKIINLDKQVGDVRSRYENGKVVSKVITCMDCHCGRT